MRAVESFRLLFLYTDLPENKKTGSISLFSLYIHRYLIYIPSINGIIYITRVRLDRPKTVGQASKKKICAEIVFIRRNMKMSDKKKFYITTAIAYTSRKPHVGNSYEIVFTDAAARFKRLSGYDVFFLTGTDEHGQKIEELAREAGISPQEHVDKIAGEIRSLCSLLNISYDKFIRTTDDYHVRSVQHIFKKLYDQGDIYKSEYSGKYCVPCESFWTESQLVDGKCPDCGREVTNAKEEAYFLKLSKYQKWLEEYIENNPDFISPESRRNEMLNNFIKPGIQDLCVSRTTVKWGIPVTFDDKHIIYIWIDALSNYITALGYDPENEDAELYKKYWPADVHVIGKDILRFHTIYWPIMLHALGLPIPKKVFGHPWMLFGTDKMSKSRGNVIYADTLAEKIGVDAVRYYLLSEMPYASDGSISYERIVERFNSDLANTLGNLVNRTVAMNKKYFGGVIQPRGACEDTDAELEKFALETAVKFSSLMDRFKAADACDAVMDLARRANKYIDETAPWVLAKDEAKKARLGTVLYNLFEAIRFIAVLTQPLMPETAEKIFAQINSDKKDLESLSAFDGTIAGNTTGEPVPLFARIDADKFFEGLKAELEAAEENAEKSHEEKANLVPVSEMIAFDEFGKIDLRAAEVLECEKIKKSKKLLKLILDDGFGKRQVVSGIAAWYKPEDLIGKKVIIVANLSPAKLCGEESCGMIVAADVGDAARVIFLDNDIPNGSKLR